MNELSEQLDRNGKGTEMNDQELNISRMASVVMDNTVEELQAKLTKAMEALRFYAPQTVGGITFVGGDDAGKRAAAVLAELEGEE